MTCPNCGSENVNVQAVNEFELKNQHHNVFWWLLIGWWWLLFKWIFLTIPALIVKIFGHKKTKVVSNTVTYKICQDCGHKWQ